MFVFFQGYADPQDYKRLYDALTCLPTAPSVLCTVLSLLEHPPP